MKTVIFFVCFFLPLVVALIFFKLWEAAPHLQNFVGFGGTMMIISAMFFTSFIVFRVGLRAGVLSQNR